MVSPLSVEETEAQKLKCLVHGHGTAVQSWVLSRRFRLQGPVPPAPPLPPFPRDHQVPTSRPGGTCPSGLAPSCRLAGDFYSFLTCEEPFRAPNV